MYSVEAIIVYFSVCSYKKRNFAELLRLYHGQGFIEKAADLGKKNIEVMNIPYRTYVLNYLNHDLQYLGFVFLKFLLAIQIFLHI